MDKSLGDAERWRAKYLDLLQQQEQDEEAWKQQQEAWRRSFVVVCLLAEGQDSALDPELQGLRQQIKKQGNAPQTDSLSTLIRSFESRQSATNQQLLQALQHSAATLLDLPLESTELQRLRSLRKRLDSELDTSLSALQLVADWLDAMPSSPVGGANAEAETGPSLWQRLFGSKKAAVGKEGNHLEEGTASMPDSPLVEADDQTLQEAMKVQQNLCQGLLRLLDQLNLSDSQQDAAQSLRQQLLAGPSLPDLVDLLEQLADLVMTALSASQTAMQSFLHQLDDQLMNLQQHLQKECFSSEGSQQARLNLSNEVQQQVGHLRSLANDDGELETLGARLQSHLVAIVSALETFDAHEQQREEAQQQEIVALNQRLQDVERQASATRQAFERQQQLAYKDALTGLPNRHAYSAHTRKLWKQLDEGGSLVLAVADVDYFKRINDQFGHQAGDRVLKLIAKTLGKHVAKPHFLARYGGEEFVIILQSQTLTEASQSAEQLRAAIESLPYHFKGDPVSITMSFGLAEARKGERLETVFERADKALYRAKQGGRNQVVVDSL